MSRPVPSLRVDRRASAWFASDLHLQDDDDALSSRVLASIDALHAATAGDRSGGFTAPPGPASPALFLLGDLFEYWVGDDHPSDAARALFGALGRLAGAGWRVCLMHGNRDFLLGADAAAAQGATLLADPCLIEVDGERIVLAHGDAECIGDAPYQQWRALCRSEAWQRDFLARPLAERLAMARAMRARSRERQAGAMTETTADLDPATIDALMTRFDASGMIHGHTHRPGLHRWQAAGTARWRRVLSDWAVDPPRGETLSLAQLLEPAAAR
ncbi:MAG: UDP-2,3-diacylglucosamine diphosphatase [Lautropia sp.]